MLHNYKLTIAYDGTAYSGWQIQPNGITIQQILQEKIAIILREQVGVTGSGRTDAGVHAKGQVAHFHVSTPLDIYRFQGSLNGLLPPDIRILDVSEVPESFHARYNAKGKIYHYHLHLDRVQNPFTRLYSMHVRENIDVDLLNAAAKKFIGKHDFTSFANEAHLGCASNDPIRTLKRLDVFDTDGGIRLEFEADGFLYKMVRNLTGMLLDISSGKYDINEIEVIFAAKDRRKAGMAAPPQGLFLMHVDY